MIIKAYLLVPEIDMGEYYFYLRFDATIFAPLTWIFSCFKDLLGLHFIVNIMEPVIEDKSTLFSMTVKLLTLCNSTSI